jgi:hypothetical protein
MIPLTTKALAVKNAARAAAIDAEMLSWLAERGRKMTMIEVDLLAAKGHLESALRDIDEVLLKGVELHPRPWLQAAE